MCFHMLKRFTVILMMILCLFLAGCGGADYEMSSAQLVTNCFGESLRINDIRAKMNKANKDYAGKTFLLKGQVVRKELSKDGTPVICVYFNNRTKLLAKGVIIGMKYMADVNKLRIGDMVQVKAKYMKCEQHKNLFAVKLREGTLE